MYNITDIKSLLDSGLSEQEIKTKILKEVQEEIKKQQLKEEEQKKKNLEQTLVIKNCTQSLIDYYKLTHSLSAEEEKIAYETLYKTLNSNLIDQSFEYIFLLPPLPPLC